MANQGQIVIQVDALTDTANEKLQSFFQGTAQNLDRFMATSAQSLLDAFKEVDEAPAKLKEQEAALEAQKAAQLAAANAAKANSAALKGLRAEAMLAGQGFRGLESIVLVLGGERFPELMRTMIGVRGGAMALRSASILTGESIAALALPLGIVGAALAGGALLWSSYSQAEKEAAEASKKNMESLREIPGMLGQIDSMMRAGRMSPAAAKEFADILGGRTKMFKGSDGQLTKFPVETVDQAPAGRPQQMGFATFEAPREPAKQLPEATQAEINAYVKEQLENKGAVAAEATNKLKEEEDRARLETLNGLAKEEEAIRQRYQKEREEIQRNIELKKALGDLTPGEEAKGNVALKNLDEGEAAAITEARQKDRMEQEREEREKDAKLEGVLATQAKVDRDNLERELTLAAAQGADKRESRYEEEFSKRKALLDQQHDEAVISEQEYTSLVEQAAAKREEARKKEHEDEIRMEEAQNAIELARVQGARRLIEMDPDLTESEKKEKLIDQLALENSLIEKNIQDKERQAQDLSLSPEARMMAEKSVGDLRQRAAETEMQMSALEQQGTFKGEFGGMLTSLKNEWGSWAAQMAGTFHSVFEGTISSVSHGITGLILQTKTWGQALREIGTSILTQVVEGIVQMGVRWVLTQALMAIMGKTIMASSVAAMAPLALAASGIWSAPATLATIATYGGAAADAPGLIALAEGLTLAQSLTSGIAAAEGGLISGPGSGTSDSIPARLSNGEFVVRAAQASKYLDLLHLINSGRFDSGAAGINNAPSAATMAGGQLSGPAINHRTVLNLATFGSEAEAEKWANSTNGETWFHNMMNKTVRKFIKPR